MKRISLIVVVCLMLAACSQTAKQPLSSPPQSAAASKDAIAGNCAGPLAPASIRAEAGYREVLVSAFAHGDDAPIKLRADDLELSQNGKPVPIAIFAAAPASVGILVDTSGSMSPKLHQAGLAITQIVEQLNPADEIFLMAFEDRPYLLQQSTTDHAQVTNKVVHLNAYGQTALYDAVLAGLQKLQGECNAAKALILISDGDDNASSHSKEDLREGAEHADIPIYAIGIGHAPKEANRTFLGIQDQDTVDFPGLDWLAIHTGGKAYLVSGARDGTSLDNHVATIAPQIDGYYMVGFVALNPATQLALKLRKHPDARLKTLGNPSLIFVNNRAKAAPVQPSKPPAPPS